MAEFKKRGKNNFWHSPLVLLVLFCILVIFAYNMIGLIKKERDTADKRALTLTKIDSLNSRVATLSENIDKLNTEEGVEEIIRDKYQVVKPGEKMLVIVDDKKAQETSEKEGRGKGFWDFLKNIFKRN